MRILIDMNLSPEWETVFEAEYEVRHWSKIGNPDDLDEVILDYAKQNGYLILTNDLDFGAILAATKLDSPSVFQIRSLALDPVLIGGDVLACFKKFEPDLIRGALLSYETKKARVRLLPF